MEERKDDVTLKQILRLLLRKDKRLVEITTRVDRLEEKLEKICIEHVEFDKVISIKLEGIGVSLDFIKEAINKKDENIEERITVLEKRKNNGTKKLLGGIIHKMIWALIVLVAIIFGMKGADIWKMFVK